MSQSIDLGRIRFYYRDAYNANTTYEINDVVSYGGSAYVYKYATNASGNLPTDTTYWSKLSEGSDFRGTWLPSTAYFPNDIVIYENGVYIALIAHTSSGSSSSFFLDYTESKWSTLTYGFKWEGTWTANTLYHPYDVVSYAGNTYVATTQFTSDVSLFDNDTGWSLFAQGSAGGEVATQTSNSGKLLSTDGTITEWVSNISIDDVTANTLNIADTANVGTNAATFFSSLTNPVAVYQIDAPDFAQLSFRNLGTNANSSTDIICYADIGDDDTGWIDMGITSTNFSDPEFTITGAHDGYIFVEGPANSLGGGNLVLATGGHGTDNAIIFAAGGLLSDNTQMTIYPDQNVHIEISTASVSPTTGALTVVGGIGTQGNINLLGDLTVQGSITVSGGAFQAETVTSIAPIFSTGAGATGDLIERGFIAEYKRTTSDYTFDIGSVESSNTTLTIRRLAYGTSTKTLTSNVATVDLGVAHTIVAGEEIIVSNLGAPFDGTHTVTTVGANTVSYAVENADIATAGDVDGEVAPQVSNTLIVNGDRIIIANSNIAAINGNRDFVIAVSGNTVTANFTTVVANTLATGDIVVNTKTAFTGLVRGDSSEGNNWYLLGNIPPASSNGVHVPPTNDINLSSNTLTYGTMKLNSLALVANGNTAPTITGDATVSGNIAFTGTPTFTGGIRVQEMNEDVYDLGTLSGAATSISANYQDANIFYINFANAAINPELELSNVPTTNGRIFTINLIVNQGQSTGYFPATMTINGSASISVKWPAGAAPVPTSDQASDKIDIFSYTILRLSNTWTVFGSTGLNF